MRRTLALLVTSCLGVSLPDARADETAFSLTAHEGGILKSKHSLTVQLSDSEGVATGLDDARLESISHLFFLFETAEEKIDKDAFKLWLQHIWIVQGDQARLPVGDVSKRLENRKYMVLGFDKTISLTQPISLEFREKGSDEARWQSAAWHAAEHLWPGYAALQDHLARIEVASSSQDWVGEIKGLGRIRSEPRFAPFPVYPQSMARLDTLLQTHFLGPIARVGQTIAQAQDLLEQDAEAAHSLYLEADSLASVVQGDLALAGVSVDSDAAYGPPTVTALQQLDTHRQALGSSGEQVSQDLMIQDEETLQWIYSAKAGEPDLNPTLRAAALGILAVDFTYTPDELAGILSVLSPTVDAADLSPRAAKSARAIWRKWVRGLQGEGHLQDLVQHWQTIDSSLEAPYGVLFAALEGYRTQDYPTVLRELDSFLRAVVDPALFAHAVTMRSMCLGVLSEDASPAALSGLRAGLDLLLTERQVETALDSLGQAIKDSPGFTAPLRYVAWCYMAMDQQELAHNVWATILERYPHDPAVPLDRIRSEPESTPQILRETLVIEERAYFRTLLATIFADQGQARQAIIQYSRALQANGAAEDLHAGMVRGYLAWGDLTRARAQIAAAQQAGLPAAAIDSLQALEQSIRRVEPAAFEGIVLRRAQVFAQGSGLVGLKAQLTNETPATAANVGLFVRFMGQGERQLDQRIKEKGPIPPFGTVEIELLSPRAQFNELRYCQPEITQVEWE